LLLTFSGLDGSGKTTIIGHIKDILNKTDKVCISYTIYFDISIYGIIRKIIPRSDKKKTAIQSKNQNNNTMKETISNKLLLFFRNKFTKLIIIYLDALISWVYVLYYCYIRKKILILDRYYYDFLIDIGLEGININKHYKYLSKIYPKPRLPIYIDINPSEAWNRKHEYNVEYLKEKRKYYNTIFRMNNNSLIIYNDDIDSTINKIIACL